jgi:4-aminobutyrate aminotransferase
MTKNEEILREEAPVLADATRIKYFDVVFDHGRGAILTDVDGNDYIDLLASASATNTGHAHPKVVQAIKDQAEKLIHYTPAYFANATTSALLTKLAAVTPGEFKKRVVLGNSGSDANDAIIKFARGYTGRPMIVSFTGAYHGSTYGSIALSGVSLNMSRKIGPLMPGVIKVPFPDRHHQYAYETEEQFVDRMWDDFLEPFQDYVPVDEVAAILIEPIQGDGGIVPVPQAYMERLYAFTREHGIVFAVDEVNQGMGRTGKMWSIEHYGIAPDLMSIGKSLGSGMPISAVVGRADILESLDAPANVYTTAGNPISAAAALATLEVIETEGLVERSATLGAYASEKMQALQDKFDVVGDFRAVGLNAGIDIVTPDGQPDPDATSAIISRLFELGVIMISLRGNILRFQPPLVITTDELDTAFEKLEQALTEWSHGDLHISDKKIGW